ncbi:MAG TPA: peptidase M28, partial [Blastocatellia bacterium]|nr:peptidase M28 [Blastocatellia bacterium]
MFKRYLTVFLVIASLAGSGIAGRGQATQEPVDLDAINKIKEEGLKRSQVMEILSYLTDVQGARLTNSPNIRAAQQWAKKKLTEWGLQNGNLESWPFGRGWSLESFSAGLIKPYYVPLIAYPKAWSASTHGAVRGT